MPLGSRITHDTVLEGRRGRIYGLILERPGVTFLDLVRATSGHYGVTAHHLYVLERFELVRSYRTHRSRRYYASVGDPERDRREAILREPHLRDTLAIVAQAPGLSQAEVVTRFPGLTRQAVAHRLERLIENGIVSAFGNGRNRRYRPTNTTHALAKGPIGVVAM